MITRVRSDINLGRGFPRIVAARRPKSSPPDSVNRLAQLLPWNWQPEDTKLAG
jgi:hypothetical protein